MPASAVAARSPSPAITPWYRQLWPWLLMAGPALVVIASLYSGWLALATDDGVVADDYYKRGLAINARLARVERAAALQMGAVVSVDADGRIRATLASVSTDLDASPATMRLKFTHPTRAGLDRGAELTRGPDGIYTGRIEPVAPGRWLVTLETDAWRMPAVELAGDMRTLKLGAAAVQGS